MAWNPTPRTGGAVLSAVDEFLDTQTPGWSLWSSTAAPDDSIKQEHGDAPPPCTTGPSGEEQEPWFAGPVDDVFLNQLFSDEEMRRMDGGAPFEAPEDMFLGSMNMLMVSSYENMLTGVLTGSEEQGDHAEQLDFHGVVDTTGTCGLQNGSGDAGEQDGLQSTTKRTRAVAGTESTPGFEFEAMVLGELEDVVFQLTRRTRIRYRDAFYRLADSSGACHSTSQQPDHGNASSWFPPAPGCPERETNPIDRMVMVLTMMEPPRRQVVGEDSGAEAQTATSWAA